MPGRTCALYLHLLSQQRAFNHIEPGIPPGLKVGVERIAQQTVIHELLAGSSKQHNELAKCVAMQPSDPLGRADRHTFGEHSQGELGFADVDLHVTKSLRVKVCKANTAVFALPSLLALPILTFARLSSSTV